MRKRHLLRISSIEAGKSNMDLTIEQDIVETMQLDAIQNIAKKMMIQWGKATGPVWDWMTSIKGLGVGGEAAKLLAQIDDAGKFDTVSKLWRFCGYAVIDGHREYNTSGEKSHYNRRIKGICYCIADQFIRQQTPVYVEIYYSEKERQRRIHPEKMCKTCGCAWDDCTQRNTHKSIYSDGHIHAMAIRKMIKIFLQHLWVVWREAEGLPVTNPYVEDMLGHTHIIRVKT